MSEVNSNEEILEFAIAREVEACYFYLALAGRVDNPRMRKVFEELAEEELEHKRKLELEIMKLGKTVSTEVQAGRPSGDYILADDRAVLDMDYKDVLLLAMEKEDAAFRIYVNLLGTVGDEQSREVLLAIAQEEVRHKLRFEAEYDALLKEA
ncbi:MAG TPA: ferritin family protein [Sedimentisphaerales bacterium]|nr:ferritin family protein [Sedimentisphaerales bacterium]